MAYFYVETVPLPRLDYISCALTILSTILIGRRMWQGWIVAGGNSIIICLIGLRTSQTGFIPANLFCLAIYAYNILHWRSATAEKSLTLELSGRLIRRGLRHHTPRSAATARSRVPTGNDASIRHRDRVRPRELPARR